MRDVPDLRRAARRGLLLATLWPVGALLALAAYATSPSGRALLDQVTLARPLDALGALLAFAFVFPAMGLRWRALVPGAREARIGALAISAVAASGQLIGVALPGPLGELAAAAAVQRRWGVPGPIALAASLHARVLGLLTGVLLAGTLFLIAPEVVVPEGWDRALLFGGAAVSAMVGGLTVLALAPDLFLRLQTPPWLPKSGQRLWALVAEFLTGAAQLGRSVGRAHGEAALWSAAMHGSAGLGVFLLARALGGQPDLAGVLFTQGAVSAGSLVLFVLPAQAVGADAAYAAFLVGAAGLDPGVAVVATALARLLQTLGMAAGPPLLGAELSRIALSEAGALQSGEDEAV